MSFRGLPASRRAVVFLAVPLMLLGSLPAQADSDTQGGDESSPVLVSVTAPATTFEGQGALVEIDYEMTDESGLGWVEFQYIDPIGRIRWLSDSGLDGDVEREVGPNWPTGTYTLQAIEAADAIGNYVFLNRDGSAYPNGPRYDHLVDMSLGDFAVQNDAADIAIPVLNSIDNIGANPLMPGDTAQIAYEVEDDSPIIETTMRFETPGGRSRYAFDSSWDGGVDGIAEMRVRDYTPNGHYTLESVEIRDAAGITVEYRNDGDTFWWPHGATGSDDHSIDLSLGDLVIDNPSSDDVPPVLNEAAIAGGPSFFDGEHVVLNYDAADPLGLQFVRATYEGPDGTFNRYDFSSGYGMVDPPDGALDIDTDWDQLEPGDYELKRVTIEDRSGNDITYHRNGHLTSYSAWDLGSHEVDLSLGDFTMVEWPFTYSDMAGRGMIKLDTATKKFRFQPSAFNAGPGVRTDPAMTVSNGVAIINYSADGLSVVGTFHLESGRFQATVRRGEAAITHLVRAV